MKTRATRFVIPTMLLAGLFAVAGSAPAHAADYTIDCNQTQGAPYVDYDSDPAIFYGIWEYALDGTQDHTVTINILNCGYHLVRHPAGTVVSGYLGQSTNDTYTITVPVDGIADAWGYNIWDNPQRTTFIISFTNPTPTDGGGGGDSGGGDSGGGDSGGGDSGGGDSGGGDSGGGENNNEGVDSQESAANSLAQTGFDSTSAASVGILAFAAGVALTAIRRIRRNAH